MSEGLNKCQLIGNLGADPELKFAGNGNPVLNMRLAVNETWKDKQTGERKERCEWCTCVLWGPRGEALSKHLRKGSRIYVEGKLQTRKWQAKDGSDRYTTEIVVNEVIFLDGKRDDEPRSGARYRDGGSQGAPADDFAGGGFDDPIPF